MKKGFLTILLVLQMCSVVLSQNHIGPLKDGHFFTLKIRSLKTGLRFLVFDDRSRRVSLSDDGNSIGAVWFVHVGLRQNRMISTGRGRINMGPFDAVTINPIMRPSEYNKDQNCCSLSGTIDASQMRISPRSWDTVWTAIDNEDGTVILRWMPRNLGQPDTVIMPAGEFYLFVDNNTGEFKYVTNPSDATSWYPSEVSIEDKERRQKAW